MRTGEMRLGEMRRHRRRLCWRVSSALFSHAIR